MLDLWDLLLCMLIHTKSVIVNIFNTCWARVRAQFTIWELRATFKVLCHTPLSIEGQGLPIQCGFLDEVSLVSRNRWPFLFSLVELVCRYYWVCPMACCYAVLLGELFWGEGGRGGVDSQHKNNAFFLVFCLQCVYQHASSPPPSTGFVLISSPFFSTPCSNQYFFPENFVFYWKISKWLDRGWLYLEFRTHFKLFGKL